MKIMYVLLVAAVASFGFCTARADNKNGCFWMHYVGQQGSTGDTQRREYTMLVPGLIKLNMVPVGQVMATTTLKTPSVGGHVTQCPPKLVPRLNIYYDLAPGHTFELESGYADVYATGLLGIGVRLRSTYYSKDFVIPGGFGFGNGIGLANVPMYELTYEFVRTQHRVVTGEFSMAFTVRYKVDDWYAVYYHGSGVVNTETDSYFAGCAGLIKDIKVPMGSVWTGELSGHAKTTAFDLGVRCIGLPRGSKLPVKAYFEGDSPGDGRLNLLGGGAMGAEIELRTGQGAGTALPFSVGQAVNMSWLRSDAEGELYTLPIKARYVQKPNTKVEPGKADAVLNYIIEYN